MTPLSVEELAELRRRCVLARKCHFVALTVSSDALRTLLDTIEALQGALSVERLALAVHAVSWSGEAGRSPDFPQWPDEDDLAYAAALLAALDATQGETK